MFTELEIEKIVPNPFQPRTAMDTDKLEEIACSIKQVGLVQPLVVRDCGDGVYQIIAGERRFRGAKRAGLLKVPAVVRKVTDEEMLNLALIENIHREDLSCIDRAMGFRDLIDKFGMTQKRIAEIYNLSRPAVANTLRLLDLEEEIRDALHQKRITEGHARALMLLKDSEQRLSALKRIVCNNLSVRDTEDLARKIHKQSRLDKKRQHSVHEHRLIDELRMKLGTRVDIVRENGTGKIEIEFYTEEDLERITEILL